MQVKHLQGEFEESKGGLFHNEDRKKEEGEEGGERQEVLLLSNYVVHRCERVCDLFFFFQFLVLA